ncbi:hypothetical protein GZ212_13715 [Mangrovimonas sp. CR14]|uniref:hypothetical protein n=1 Tax=Mangrovimonas sp. CR14 TaxID=2706120 RepID=UPI00141FA0A5|nr:hypothetical protein [Mangrovimonas sp. CR14]NIK93215.1 hypothetical protein [Mangrovimonas sp. CR14]
MHKYLIIFLFLIFNLTFGQEKDDPAKSLIEEFKMEMNRENIKNFFIVKHITYVSKFLIFNKEDSTACNPNGYFFNLYGFWKNGNEAWIKKYDNCGGFNSIKLVDSKPVDFFIENIEELKKGEVEIYIIKPDSMSNGKKYSYTSTRLHSPQRFFWFFSDSSEFQKNFDKYNLETEEDNKNLNYESNNNLSIAKLNSICEDIIYRLEEKEVFSRLK